MIPKNHSRDSRRHRRSQHCVAIFYIGRPLRLHASCIPDECEDERIRQAASHRAPGKIRPREFNYAREDDGTDMQGFSPPTQPMKIGNSLPLLGNRWVLSDIRIGYKPRKHRSAGRRKRRVAPPSQASEGAAVGPPHARHDRVGAVEAPDHLASPPRRRGDLDDEPRRSSWNACCKAIRRPAIKACASTDPAPDS
ncbi:hypothetical protein LMIY3S_04510 [Labrys miyagiensis]